MKRFVQLLGILILAAMLFSIGTITMPGNDYSTPPIFVQQPPDSIDELFLQEPDARPAIIEYGAINVIKNNGSLTNPDDNNFHAYVAFPQAGHSTDLFISEWAHELYNTKVDEFAAVRSTNPSAIGEINVQFDSYLVDNRYVGILFHGVYAYELTPDFNNLIQTFNIDLSREIILETSDIFDPLQIDTVLSLLVETLISRHSETAFYLDHVDESWLAHIVIAPTGIIVYLPEGEFLPGHFPTLSVLLSYRNLGQTVIIRNQPPLDEPPLDEPSAPEVTPERIPEPGDGEYDDDNENGDGTDVDGENDGVSDDVSDEEENDYFYDDEVYMFIPEVDPQRPIIDGSRPIIALTFDDGPGKYTDMILDLLEQYNIRATFSVVGNLISSGEETLVRASLNGNEIIGHSWNHRNLAKLTENQVRRQLIDTAEAIRAATGVSSNLFRPPYGEINDTIRAVATDLGFTMLNWSVDPMDWKYQDANEIFNYVLENVRDRDIIISHENNRATVEAYTRLIPVLMLEGFQFVTVTELLQWSQIIAEPGEVITSG